MNSVSAMANIVGAYKAILFAKRFCISAVLYINVAKIQSANPNKNGMLKNVIACFLMIFFILLFVYPIFTRIS